MPAYVYLSCLAIVLSLPLLWWSLAGVRTSNRAVRDNLGPAREDVTMAGHTTARPLIERASRSVSDRLPPRWIESLDNKIGRAGFADRWTVQRVMTIKLGLAVAVLVIGTLQAVARQSPVLFLLTLAVAAGAFMLPDLQIAGKGNERQRQLELQLPDVLDQLTVSVEAGLGFDSALARVVASGEGPVHDEFARVLQDIRLGLPRDAALDALAQRTTVSDLRLFLASVSQAAKYGLPLASVMRVQAAELREKRKFRAEERAMKIPVKIVVPLIVCILPALFIVLLGPAFVRISDTGLFGG